MTKLEKSPLAYALPNTKCSERLINQWTIKTADLTRIRNRYGQREGSLEALVTTQLLGKKSNSGTKPRSTKN